MKRLTEAEFDARVSETVASNPGLTRSAARRAVKQLYGHPVSFDEESTEYQASHPGMSRADAERAVLQRAEAKAAKPAAKVAASARVITVPVMSEAETLTRLTDLFMRAGLTRTEALRSARETVAHQRASGAI